MITEVPKTAVANTCYPTGTPLRYCRLGGSGYAHCRVAMRRYGFSIDRTAAIESNSTHESMRRHAMPHCLTDTGRLNEAPFYRPRLIASRQISIFLLSISSAMPHCLTTQKSSPNACLGKFVKIHDAPSKKTPKCATRKIFRQDSDFHAFLYLAQIFMRRCAGSFVLSQRLTKICALRFVIAKHPSKSYAS